MDHKAAFKNAIKYQAKAGCFEALAEGFSGTEYRQIVNEALDELEATPVPGTALLADPPSESSLLQECEASKWKKRFDDAANAKQDDTNILSQIAHRQSRKDYYSFPDGSRLEKLGKGIYTAHLPR